ncbi:Glutamate decarboxylase [Mycena indigotica]|uniref:DNA-directed DNA polymerase n=1 Tax=Mycena indigotica TaxID=2126181 RepID=A0A8H6W179_9AGAR|nr:Glutamate decarboxylase [Mycena indigotica]KAF7301784.1 Glutamate decarboxylase [Mycena indigotica]
MAPSRLTTIAPPGPPPTRPLTTILPPTVDTPSFIIAAANKSYKHQYANVYFLRLQKLKETVAQKARDRWQGIEGDPKFVHKVLEVEKSQLSYIVGTVYMDMPLKPNILEDIARDNSIPPPPPRPTFYSKDDRIMLEDESGRLELVGDRIADARLVTGAIIAALGVETPNGEFEVVDICFAGLAPQPENVTMEVDDDPSHDSYIAVVSGLDIGSAAPSDAPIQLLVEFLTGEGGGPGMQARAAQISRLIIAGDSLAAVGSSFKPEGSTEEKETKKSRRYGYDTAAFSPHPMQNFSAHLLDIARTMPVHLLPGETDPSGVILPQQPLPRAMFGAVSSYENFSCETNPTYLRIAPGPDEEARARTLLVHSGQPINDMLKYLASPPNTPLSIAEATLRWRHIAPTAPDTLWCHPYFEADPFLISTTPDLYLVGGQRSFGTKVVTEKGNDKKKCRVVLIPRFAETGIIVMVNLRTLGVKCVQLAVEGELVGPGKAQVKREPSPPS